MSKKIFVYGTLRKGYANHRIISDYVKRITPATIRGWMFNLGPYPAVVQGDGYVEGELIEFKEAEFEKAFQVMDRLEGFSTPGSLYNHYERITTEAITRDKRKEECFVYIYSNDHKSELLQNDSIIYSGDWSQKDQETWLPYFAYGSCMNTESFSKDVPEFKVIGRAMLPNFRVGFTRKSIKWGAGVADIVYEPNHSTEGLLYLVPQSLLDSLDRREGAGKMYRCPAYQRKEIIVEIDGIKIKALTYEVVNKADKEIAPSEEYKRTILEGTELLSKSYVKSLQDHMTQLT
jgi:gamma-glutamylcyclotransferase (GGCT)/AIG2-like uncharacterized protein YtfP